MKAFLKAGVLGEDGVERDTVAGTPQGGILSPLLANIALSLFSTSISLGPGRPRWGFRIDGSDADAKAWPTIALSAMRTIG